MDSVIFLAGSTRGAALESIGRSLAKGFEAFGLQLHRDRPARQCQLVLRQSKSIDFSRVRLVFSWVSMGADIRLTRPDGTHVNLWQSLNIPFITLHGDSPAYFFDRHVVQDSNIVSFYGFDEHRELRKRLPKINGPIDTLWPVALDEIPAYKLDFKAKRKGKLLFLKNGKDPAVIRNIWRSILAPRLAARHPRDRRCSWCRNLDDPANNQIDDLVTRYFNNHGFDTEHLLKLRLLFIAQLDDYLRAVKCTRMAEALMDFPVEIRGNNWGHLDFSGKKAQYIDDCDYCPVHRLDPQFARHDRHVPQHWIPPPRPSYAGVRGPYPVPDQRTAVPSGAAAPEPPQLPLREGSPPAADRLPPGSQGRGPSDGP